MSVKTDASGRRWIEVETEVPGTPEEVWQAIATGPGISSWFVATDIRDDGTLVSHFGPGMDAVGRVTLWDPPRRFSAEGDGFSPNAPPLATEWSVEARGGASCIVRVVHSLFAAADDWDDELESMESGWPGFFRVLRLYLAHFRGQPCSTFRAMAFTSLDEAQAWKVLTTSLGLANARAGQSGRTGGDTPSLAGHVEHTDDGRNPHLLLRAESPSPGAIWFGAVRMGDQTCLVMSAYFYGADAATTVAREEPRWQGWVAKVPGVPSGA